MHTELSSSNRSVINLVFVTLRASTESQLSAKPKPVVEDEEDEEEDNSSDEGRDVIGSSHGCVRS